uniref:Septal ring factor EnvC, activator of murein hydrolases AmiA and AmiB n=1 Tax=Candidatus Kentrum eta TaxID=2126337 RepID=A0A450VFC1_9GAMM|nr:MAG: Septal ring factor EnvC, activator of murein hydrolases AmiA and AmiB [Candidatus Kentron sp. H]VFK03792.1 MAG: Septal ring factor EnvC, activator of murein hydrolases AmiA and AmiB [Candidatus Kentron sp. H]VFK06801.1 MAG: Septal ring factor EnvC, activator of murein hydrolases AmiA and AmiB [Candidatus Kentron sp. H]
MIRALSSRLGYARSKRDAAQEKLRATELAIGRLATEFRRIENGLRKQQKQLASLRRERDEKTAALVAQREALARQIRFSYAMGRQDYLKIFLNQENPYELARVLTYYGYFNRARAERIEATRQDLARLDVLEGAIDQETTALQGLKQAKEKVRGNLKALLDRRRRVLAKLAKEITRDDQRLARLKQNKDRLEKLITGIRRKLKSFDHHKSFRGLKGELEWPTVGPLLNRFGAKRDPGGMRWQGVRIAARSGRPVRAISRGRVVFADWLRGFGLLLIIDHGDGYMSLYGHNQSLYKQSEDWVESGDIIASVGNSGGNAENSLYFEIRHQGHPQDPAIWCK